jgi:hypothetical protein
MTGLPLTVHSKRKKIMTVNARLVFSLKELRDVRFLRFSLFKRMSAMSQRTCPTWRNSFKGKPLLGQLYFSLIELFHEKLAKVRFLKRFDQQLQHGFIFFFSLFVTAGQTPQDRFLHSWPLTLQIFKNSHGHEGERNL